MTTAHLSRIRHPCTLDGDNHNVTVQPKALWHASALKNACHRAFAVVGPAGCAIRAGPLGRAWSVNGVAWRMMFSATVRLGSRLKLWKITPMSWLRYRYRSCSDKSAPSYSTLPSVGLASPEISDSRVVSLRRSVEGIFAACNRRLR